LRYLLDANACIRILNDSSSNLVERLRRHQPSEIVVCSIVRAELIYGARKSTRVSENLELLARFFEPLGSLPFDDASAEHYGTIRTELERAGTPIGPNDLLIAATARAHGLILVSHNLKEFRRVNGLKVEDWEEGPG
jgi:tRNA(fMet)-specific endonuclease VapC